MLNVLHLHQLMATLVPSTRADWCRSSRQEWKNMKSRGFGLLRVRLTPVTANVHPERLVVESERSIHVLDETREGPVPTTTRLVRRSSPGLTVGAPGRPHRRTATASVQLVSRAMSSSIFRSRTAR
jgi:hypothetical protein